MRARSVQAPQVFPRLGANQMCGIPVLVGDFLLPTSLLVANFHLPRDLLVADFQLPTG